MIKTKRKTFESSKTGGFKICFENGLVLSTQFGPGTYSDNHNAPFLLAHILDVYTANKVEVAIFDSLEDGKWITKLYRDDGDDVLGYISFKEWVKIFDWCRKFKKTK